MVDPSYYLGIDPGQGGGFAWLYVGGSVAKAVKMPETDSDIFDGLGWHLASGWPCMAFLEQVNAGVFGARKTGQRMGVASAFSFGKGYGGLLMALTAHGIPFELVSPVKWQTALGCRTKGDKNVSKRKAQQLFPDVKVTHAIADALLLAEWGRRHFPRSTDARIAPKTEVPF